MAGTTATPQSDSAELVVPSGRVAVEPPHGPPWEHREELVGGAPDRLEPQEGHNREELVGGAPDRLEPQEGHPCDIKNVQTFSNLCQHLARAAAGKRAGHDGLQTDALRVAPRAMCRHLHPLAVKASLTREPLDWKGGVAVPLWKGRGLQHEVNTYRSIMLQSTIGKLHHKFVRTRLLEVAGHMLKATQFSCKAGLGADFACLLARTAQARARKSRHNFALFFVDLQSAYYRAVRELLLPLEGSDEDTDAILQLDIPEWAGEVLQLLLRTPCSLEGIDDQHLLRILCDVHTDTWFAVDFAKDVARSRRGSRPGNPMADVIFALILAPVLHETDVALAGEGLKPQVVASARKWLVGPGESLEDGMATDTTYADDMAFMIEAAPHKDFLASVGFLVDLVHKGLVSRGLLPHFGPGKSGVLISANGQGAARLKQSLLDGALKTTMVTVLLVADYVHLGGVITNTGAMHHEVSRRIASHNEAVGVCGKQVFRQRGLAQQHKVTLYRSLGESRLLYNAGTWADLTATDERRLGTAYTNALRKALGLYWTSDRAAATDYEVLLRAGLLTLKTQLRMRRLKLLGRIIARAPLALRAAIDNHIGDPASWAARMMKDWEWAQELLADDSPKVEGDDLPAFIRASPRQWAHLLRLVQRNALRMEIETHEQTRWRKSLAGWMAEAGVERSDWKGKGSNIDNGTFPCYSCGAVLQSHRAWTCHQRRAHGLVSTTAWLADGGTTCNFCMKDFHDNHRLQHHLGYDAPRCRQAYLQRWHARNCPQGSAGNASCTHTAHRLPPRKVFGPSFRPPDADDPLHGHIWGNAAPQADLLQQHNQGTQMEDAEPNTQAAVALVELRVAWRFILHLFSGPRRANDLQHEIDALQMPGIAVLSLDISLDAQLGDLTRPAAVLFWMQKLRDGAVVLVMAGPPCESWSVARYRQVEREDGSGAAGDPRPLRSRDQLWGVHNLTGKEHTQVKIGNQLMRTAVEFATACIAHGVPMLLEHPACPRHRPEAASCWYLDEIIDLRRCPGVRLLNFDQCTTGRLVPHLPLLEQRKPTHFLTVHLSTLKLARLENSGQCCHKKGHITQVGKEADGSWRTSKCKLYPPGLCKWIAEALAEHISAKGGHWTPEQQDMPHDVQPFWHPLVDELVQVIPADFARTKHARRIG